MYIINVLRPRIFRAPSNFLKHGIRIYISFVSYNTHYVILTSNSFLPASNSINFASHSKRSCS
jgi:hypothetical protein